MLSTNQIIELIYEETNKFNLKDHKLTYLTRKIIDIAADKVLEERWEKIVCFGLLPRFAFMTRLQFMTLQERLVLYIY